MRPGRRTVYLSIGSVLLIGAVEFWVFSLDPGQRIKALRVHLFLIIQTILFLSERYIWRRIRHLLQPISSFPIINLPIKLILILTLSLSQASTAFMFLHVGVGTEPLYISRISVFCLGLVIFLNVSLITSDICSFAVRKLTCKNRSAGLDDTDGPKSRIGGSNALRVRTLLALIATVILAYSGLVGVSNFTVKRIQIPIKGLDRRLNGTTILQLSDIHMGPYNGRTALMRILDRVNKLNVDVVVITGDLVDSSVAALHEAVTPLREIRAKYGVYYSTGNHEYYTGDVDNWIKEVARLNVIPLVNKRVCLLSRDPAICKGGLYLAGLEDIETRRLHYGSHSMDLHAALSGREKGIPTVVLAHQPWAAVEAIMWEDVRLVLSGHTHAGQIFPMMIFAYLYNPFFVGLYQPYPDVFVYVSPGSLYYLVPFRHYRPEITHITLISN